MKTSRFALFLAAALSPAALMVSGCNKSEDTSTAMDTAKADAKAVVADVKAAASDTWDGVRDYTYDKRTEFSASMDRMGAKLDEKTRDLRAKVAGAPDTASSGWAGATGEYDAARADLKSRLTDLGNATDATWTDAKEKVSQSWKRLQAAYDKMKSDVSS